MALEKAKSCTSALYLPEEQLLATSQLSSEDREPLVQELHDNIGALFSGTTSVDLQKVKSNIYILAHHGDQRLYPLLMRLLEAPSEQLSEWVGEEITIFDFPLLLVKTFDGDWVALKEKIRRCLSLNHQSILIEAAKKLVVLGEILREEYIAFAKHWLRQALAGEEVDEGFLNHLLLSLSELWPEECLEEIKELYGVGLMENAVLSIQDVLDDYALGKEELYRKHAVLDVDFLKPLEQKEIDDQTSDDILSMLRQFAHHFDAKNHLLKTKNSLPGRNEACLCGSGKKFKRCCSSLFQPLRPQEMERIEDKSYTITYDPLTVPCYSEEEQVKVNQYLYGEGMLEEEAIVFGLNMVDKYPTKPAVYSHLWAYYQRRDQKIQAHRVLHQMLEKFPEYLYGKVYLAQYYQHCGENHRVPEAFNYAYDLQELYPERSVFHVGEFEAFYVTYAKYYIKTEEFRKAEQAISLLEQVCPDHALLEDMKHSLFEGKKFSLLTKYRDRVVSG